MADGKNKRGWTPRRMVRWAGTASIAIALFMAVFGAYGMGPDAAPKLLYIYWTVFFVFLMSAVVLAMIDALMTMAKFKREHNNLKQMARNAFSGGVEAGQLRTHPTNDK